MLAPSQSILAITSKKVIGPSPPNQEIVTHFADQRIVTILPTDGVVAPDTTQTAKPRSLA